MEYSYLEKIGFFGHQIRNKNSRLIANIVQGKIEEKRGRGRPKICYTENIKQWTGMTMRELIHACHDSEGWRKIVMKAARAANAPEDDAG